MRSVVSVPLFYFDVVKNIKESKRIDIIPLKKTFESDKIKNRLVLYN